MIVFKQHSNHQPNPSDEREDNEEHEEREEREERFPNASESLNGSAQINSASLRGVGWFQALFAWRLGRLAFS